MEMTKNELGQFIVLLVALSLFNALVVGPTWDALFGSAGISGIIYLGYCAASGFAFGAYAPGIIRGNRP